MAISNSIIGGLNTLDGGSGTNSSQVAETFVSFGTVKSNSYFSISMSGSYDDALTVDNANIDDSEIYPSDGTYYFDGRTMNLTITDKISWTWILAIRIYVNNTLVAEKKSANWSFYGGTARTISISQYFDCYFKEFTISGKKHVYVEVDYCDDDDHKRYMNANADDKRKYYNTSKFELGSIYYYPLVYSELKLGAYPTKQKFYKNETFSSSGLLAYAYYNFHEYVGGNHAYLTNVTDLISITTPSMTMIGKQWVSCKYNGKATGYYIEVVDVASVSENTPTNFKIDHETNPGTPSTVVITYTDGTTREVSATDCKFEWISGDFNSTGDKTWTYSVYDENTKSTIKGTTVKKVFDVSSLELSGTYKTSYQTNESLDTSGMIFTATYGEAGSEIIDASKITFSGFISTAVASSLPITCSFRTGTCKFDIKVDGITAISIILPQASSSNNVLKHLRGDTSTSLTEGITLYYTTSDGGQEELSLSSPKVSIDTSEVNINENGIYSVNITVSHEGNSITSSYQVEIYSLESLVLTNYKKEFVYSNSAPTFSIGSLSVQAHFSDGTERTLSSSEYTYSQPDNMEIGKHEVIVSSTIGVTVSETYEIEVVEDYPITITSVDISKWTNVFTKGQTFSKNGIVVKATMYSGATNKIVDFYTTLDNKVFGTDITTAETSFNIKVEGKDDEVLTYGSSITAIYDKLEKITVDTTNAKTTYKAGEAISKDGLVVTATYHTSGNKVLQASDYTLSRTTAFSKADKGSVAITITYQDQTVSFNVNVIVLDSLSISVSKTQYDRYDDIDLSTITLTKKYSDNSTETLSVGNSVITGRKEKVIPNNSDGKTTTLTFSYTEALITKSVSYNFTVKCLSSIALSVDNISVNYGESLNLVGKIVNIKFNTGESYLLAINSGNTVVLNGTTYQLSFSLDSTIIKNKVDATIGMTYGQETVYDTFTIHCISLGFITLTSSTYSSADLYANDIIELKNFALTKTIVSTDTTDTTYPQTTELEVSEVTFNIDDNYRLLVGDNKIIATYSMGLGNTYQSKSASITLNAKQIELQSINVDKTALVKALDSYVDGQSLNLVGLVVNAVFNRTASNRELDLTECKVYIDEEERYYTTSLSTSDNNKSLVISYTYNGTTKKAEIGKLTVIAKQLVSIKVSDTATQKVSFLIGDTFSSDGLIIEATYNDGYEEYVSKGSDGLSTSLDSKSEIFKQSDVGSIAVTVYLTVGTITKSTTYNITISNPQLKSIRYDSSLIKLSVTNGNTFSLTGLKVYGKYENNYEEEVEYTTPNIATELSYDSEGKVNFSSDNLGLKNVTLQVQNPYISTQLPVTTNLPVTVTPNLALVDIKLEFDEDNDPYDYRVGDTFTAKGLIVKALYKDTDWIIVSDYETSNPTLGSLLRSGGRLEVKVSYTSNGVVKSQTYTITVAMPYDSGLVEEKTYKIVFNVSKITHEEAEIEFSEDTQLPLFFSNYVSVDNDETSSTYGLNIYTGSTADSDCIGYVKLGSTSEIDGSVIENGQVILFDDPVNPIDGQGNIVVKFPHYVQGYADRINKCKFGIIYNKRLFVSGNTEFPNTDWHSSQVNSSQVENYDTEEDRDLTYFSDLDYCRYGSENSAVKGYDIYRDGTLLVFKGKANHEATIYTRQQQLVNASSYDGTIVSEGELAEEAYPCFEVNPNGGAGAISNYSIINFVGETIVLTSEGLKAITSKESTYNNAKYTYDVSSHINNRLIKNNNLSYAIISQFQEKLLLKTDEGLYIGEYKLRDENSEYEWYFCSNINAHYFFELDDELYFSDTNGNICRFVNDTSINRKDKPRTYIGLAGTTLDIDANNDTIIVSKEYADDVVNGNEFHLLNKISKITGDTTDESQVYATMGLFIDSNARDNYLKQGVSTFDQTAYAGVIDADNNELVIKPYTSSGDIDYERMNDINLLFYDYKVIYLDKIDGNSSYLDVDKAYRLKRVDSTTPFDYRYNIIDSDEEVIDLHGIVSFRINFRVNGLAMAYIIDAEDYGTDGGKQFKVGLPLKADEDDTSYVALDLVYYNDRNGTYQGVITKRVDVNSYFITKPFNLGHDLYQKSIYMWSIINDSQIASRMDVGYIASRNYADFEVAVKEIGGARQLTCEGLNFEKLHFTNDKLPHIYNKYKLLPRVGFIRFIFQNNEGTRMVISKLDIIYTYSLLMKGVK